jgi:hypothetical protein
MYDSLQLFGLNLGGLTSGGGFGGGIIGTSKRGSSDSSILGSFGLSSNTSITGALGGFGVDTSSFSKYLGGVTVGSLFDGSFLGTVLSNLTQSMISWFSGRLSYVVGFDISSLLSLFDNNFGNKWNNVKGSSTFSGGILQRLGFIGSTKLYSSGGSSSTRLSRTNGSYYMFDSIVKNYEPRTIRYSDIDERLNQYFSLAYMPSYNYRVTKVAMQAWGGPVEDLHGGMLTKSVEDSRDRLEVEFFKAMKEDMKTDFKDSMDAIKDEFNISIDRNTIVHKFNRFRVPTPDNELTTSIGYVFFTRPDLNLTAEYHSPTGSASGVAEASPLMLNMLSSHAGLASYLMGKSGSQADNSHSFIPILTHCCTGFDISDETLDTVETGETFTGWKMNYGTSLVRSKSAGTVNIGFTDDNMLSVFKLMKTWIEYISSVYRGLITPKQEYVNRHILDYAISIYYFLCNATGEDILFYTKYTGCFPTAAPSSNFSDTLGNRVHRPNYSVPFAYARKDDYNPLIIAEFNYLADTGNFRYLPIYNKESLRVHKSFVGAPFVDTLDGARLFKLRWRAPE